MTASTSIYLDNNATTRVAKQCADALVRMLTACYGNPSSKHSLGDAAKSELISARAKLAMLIGATPSELVFTSGGTESIHHAITSVMALAPERRRIVTTTVEHSATLKFLEALEGHGYEVVKIPVDRNGELSLDTVDRSLTDETGLFSCLWANNETGVLFPIEALARIAKERGIWVHCDAVQAVGKLPVDVSLVPVDFLSLSGHKFGAPKGVGALFVRKGVKATALHPGSQERGRRGGTENLPGIVALGVAAELAQQRLQSDIPARIQALTHQLEAGLKAELGSIRINGDKAPRVPGTTSLNLGGMVPAEMVLDKLDRKGIHASAGSACSAAGSAPSHVLIAMGLDENEALSTLRFSLSHETTADQIQIVIDVLPEIVREAMNESQ